MDFYKILLAWIFAFGDENIFSVKIILQLFWRASYVIYPPVSRLRYIFNSYTSVKLIKQNKQSCCVFKILYNNSLQMHEKLYKSTVRMSLLTIKNNNILLCIQIVKKLSINIATPASSENANGCQFLMMFLAQSYRHCTVVSGSQDTVIVYLIFYIISRFYS